MRPAILTIWAACLGALCAATGCAGSAPPSKHPEAARSVDAAEDAGSAVTGASSCSASACHGDTRAAPVPPRRGGNEHRVWLERDPHSRSYLTLFDQRSARIAELMTLTVANEPAERAARHRVPAHQASECLACHAPSHTPAPRESRFVAADGVGCEDCHGAARDWLHPHVNSAWRGRRAADKADDGFADLGDLDVRARRCAGCHVGDPGGRDAPRRDVTHEMIAAGHPRLDFEFSSQLLSLPRHWREEADEPASPRFDPNFTVRAWHAGQAAVALQTVALLARDGSKGREFARYRCNSCHHALAPPDPARAAARRQASDPFGIAALRSWPTTIARSLADAPAGLPAWRPVPFDPIDAMCRDWQGSTPQSVADAAAFRKALRSWTNARPDAAIDPDALRGALLSSNDADDPSHAPTEWDDAAQVALALAAVERCRRADVDGALFEPSPYEQALDRLFDELDDESRFAPLRWSESIRQLKSLEQQRNR